MIDDRLMQKVWYRKVGGKESLWVTHPVQNPGGSNSAMQWAQIDVTGGTIATTPVQQQIHSPDANLYRFMGSLAVDGQGNMALGYTASSGTTYPGIRYAGRLAGDPLGTLPQAEATLMAGGGSQANTCGGAPCDRWGDYSSMSVDPSDDCTFWYANEYYDTPANGTAGNWHTRIGSFRFPSCSSLPATTTTLASSANPILVGASVTFTAAVAGAAPTGTVAFTDNGAIVPGCSAVALAGGGNAPTATCTVTVTTAGGSATTTLTITAATGTTLLSDGFEGSGWTVAAVSGTKAKWTQATAGAYPPVSPHGGTRLADLNSYTAASGQSSRIYRSSGLALPATATTIRLSFWMYHDTGYPTATDRVQPQVSTNKTSWSNLGSAVNRYNGTKGWAQVSVDLSAYRGSTVYIGFLGTSGYGNDVYLDDVSIVAQ